MEFRRIPHSPQSDIKNSRYLLHEIGTSIQYATETDIKELLQLIITTNDIEIKLKVFSIITMYLSSCTHRAAVVIFAPLYDEIYSVLIKGYPEKTGAILNFVSSLLYETEEQDSTTSASESLTSYACNMIRVSGCLSVMSRLFCDATMRQDTWRALCHCLAKVCRNSQENKNHSSNLIPKAVQKCIQCDVESRSVLLSLLHHHDRNVQLFVECGGLSIFNRERLQINAYLQLLDILVQNKKVIIILIHNTEVVDILRIFLDLYGLESQIGQWATIILYHIKLQVHALGEDRKNTRTIENIFSCIDTTLYNVLNKTVNNDTRTLLQNVGQILKYERRSNILECYNELVDMEKRTTNESLINENKYPVTIEVNNIANEYQYLNLSSLKFLKSSLADEMSFSFLCDAKIDQNKTYTVSNWHPRNVHKLEKSTGSITSKETNICANMLLKSTKAVYQRCTSTINESEQSVINFRPKFVSTPKRNKLRKNKQSLQISSFMNRCTSKSQYITDIYNDKGNNKKMFTKKSKEIKHKSFSSKLFSTINDSCTILIKRVKNIFKTLKVDSNVCSRKEESSGVSSIDVKIKNNNCSYSFTNYMRRRDAIFGDKPLNTSSEKPGESDLEVNIGHSCDTCNDTLLLKYKLSNDDHLRQTIKKLKYGINLYGCNFKKISGVLFSRDPHLTPNALYNLYRKLIVK